MAKRTRPARRVRQETRQTNWWLIGGIIVVGLIGLIALLVLATQEGERTPLAEYCANNPGNCPSKGLADAPVTIVEVSDYGCSHCRDFNLQTAGLIEDLYVKPGDVQWLVLPFATSASTLPAANAALCAAEQGRFFEYHNKLFEMNQGPQTLTPEGFTQTAVDLGLDAESLNACLAAGTYEDVVQKNIRAANTLDLRVTPTFYINGQKLEGNRPLTVFQQQIASLLGTADAN